MTVALQLVALILSGINLVQSKGQSLLGWAVFCLSLSLVWPVLRAWLF